MNWNTGLPGGNVRNTVPLAELKLPIICDVDISFTSLSDVLNLTTWKTKIQKDLTVYIPRSMTGYENTTDDPNIQTTQSGEKFVTTSPPPAIKATLGANWLDYAEMLDAFRGGTYGIIWLLKDGTYLVDKDSDGKYRPFQAKVTAVNKMLPAPGEIGNHNVVHIFHRDYDDFRNAQIIKPAWGLDDLLLAMPVGLNLVPTAAIDGDDIEVLVTQRFGAGLENLTASDFEVVDSNNLDTPAITAVTDNDNGAYTVTLEKGVSPGSLAAGDYIMFRVNAGGGTLTTSISNKMLVVSAGAGA